MRVTIGAQVYTELVDGEAIILELGSGQYYGLNAVGSRLWELLRKHGSTETVIDVALNEYDVGREELKRDLEHLVSELISRRLLVPS